MTLRHITDAQGSIPFLPLELSRVGDQLLYIPSDLPLLVVGAATIVGLFAGLLPAIRAAHLLPVVALRQE